MDHQRDAESFHCAACENDSIRWHFEPFLIQDYEYCLGCVEKQFSPIVRGDEGSGLPKIGDEVLHARDDIMRLISPILRADFERCLTMLREVAPAYRVYCPWPVAGIGENCNKLLGRRADVSEDHSHQWRLCPQCEHHLCMACEMRQSEEKVNSRDCAVPRAFVNWYEQHYLDGRGQQYQFCPDCDRLTTLEQGCQEMTCVCGAIFCMGCGKEFGNRDQLRLHFDLPEPENCPQYRSPGAAEYDHPRPWIDAHNKGGWEFPELLPTTQRNTDLVRQVAYLDREIRQYRRREVDGTPHEALVTKAILRSMRHVIILMFNWQVRLERGIKLSVDDIHERFTFAHHAQQYRQQLAAWRHMRDLIAADLPTNTILSDREIPWNDIFDAARRLRLRTGATPSRWNDRREDLEAARETAARAWYYGAYGDDDLPAPDSVAPDQRPRALVRTRTKGMLASINSVLDLLTKNPRAHFSASYSTYFLTQIKQIRQQLNAIDRIDRAAFCNSGPDSEFAYEMATLLTYRLLEIEKDELALLADSRDAPEGLARRIWAQEMVLVYSEARDEALPHALPVGFGELEDSVRRLQIIMHDRGKTGTREECDELWNQYTKTSRGGKLVPDVDRGRLTPLFFHMLRILKTERRMWFGAEDLEEDEDPPDSDDDDEVEDDSSLSSS